MTAGKMTDTAARHVRLEEASRENDFVYHRGTGELIGRVWCEPNGDWWATFYLCEGLTARNVSGGKFDSRDDAIAAVWRQPAA